MLPLSGLANNCGVCVCVSLAAQALQHLRAWRCCCSTRLESCTSRGEWAMCCAWALSDLRGVTALSLNHDTSMARPLRRRNMSRGLLVRLLPDGWALLVSSMPPAVVVAPMHDGRCVVLPRPTGVVHPVCVEWGQRRPRHRAVAGSPALVQGTSPAAHHRHERWPSAADADHAPCMPRR